MVERSKLPRIVSGEFVAAAPDLDALPPPIGIEIAFAGRSNVGKSTLMNALLNRKNLVRTGSTPGVTRQIALFKAETSAGEELTLVDLPGYGYAQRSKTERKAWGALVERYLLERPSLRSVVVLVDVRRGLEQDERDLFEMLEGPSKGARPAIETVLVATKLDKLSRAAQKPALAELSKRSSRPALGFSSRDPAAADRVWRAVRAAVGLLA